MIVRQWIACSTGAANTADDIEVTNQHQRSMTNLIVLLHHFQERNLTLKDKCKTGMSHIVFMGLPLNKHGVGPTEEQVRAVCERETPNVTKLRSFLGLTSLSLKFLPNLTTTGQPSMKLTRQSQKLWFINRVDNVN